MQSVPTTNNVVSTRYNIMYVSDFAEGEWFSPNKTDRHDIAKILLKVAL